MRSRASRTFPRRDVQQKRGLCSPDHKECETEKSRPGVSPDCVRSDGVQPLPKRRKTAKTSFLLHIDEIERARRPRGAAREARAARGWRGEDGADGRAHAGDRKEQATRTGAKVARCGRRDDRVTKEVERALGPRGAGAHGGRRMRATRAHGACEMPSRARAVAGRARLRRGASPTPRAGARPPRRASSSPEATCPSSRAP